jgi:hypothetical protein
MRFPSRIALALLLAAFALTLDPGKTLRTGELSLSSALAKRHHHRKHKKSHARHRRKKHHKAPPPSTEM